MLANNDPYRAQEEDIQLPKTTYAFNRRYNIVTQSSDWRKDYQSLSLTMTARQKRMVSHAMASPLPISIFQNPVIDDKVLNFKTTLKVIALLSFDLRAGSDLTL